MLQRICVQRYSARSYWNFVTSFSYKKARTKVTQRLRS